MFSDEDKAKNYRLFLIAIHHAKKALKVGDRFRVTKCPGTKRWAVFSHWDGKWIVSKSGIDDYSARCIDMVNGSPVDFSSMPVTDDVMAEIEAEIQAWKQWMSERYANTSVGDIEVPF